KKKKKKKKKNWLQRTVGGDNAKGPIRRGAEVGKPGGENSQHARPTPIWIDESELNKPVVVAIGPNNTDGIRLEFVIYDDAKEWTERLRQSAQYYRSLAPNSSPEAPYSLVERELEMEVHHFDKAKRLGWANKRKAHLLLGWDRRYFIIHNNVLYYLSKEPQKLISVNNKQKPPKIVINGGFRISEVDACVDDASLRSGQPHCLLLYHFDRTIFIKFDERWPLLEFYKIFHKDPKYVDFSMSQQPVFITKQQEIETQNVDVWLANQQKEKLSKFRRSRRTQRHVSLPGAESNRLRPSSRVSIGARSDNSVDDVDDHPFHTDQKTATNNANTNTASPSTDEKTPDL
ncbi:hypothetical protein RFI_15578, partial [Reticulomyxa filosa]